MIELKPTIFVVDDDKSVLKSLGRLLAAAGFEVNLFSSANELISQDLTDVRGCLLLDIHMPNMNGLELQEYLKKKEVTIPIIFITGHIDDDSSVAKAMDGGAIACLYKPLDEDRLLSTINLTFQESNN